jgi:hypothetical protein
MEVGHMTKMIRVTKRAITQRIDRALAKRGEHLVCHRGTDTWHIASVKERMITRSDVDLVKLARDLDVLKPWEEVES